MDLSTVSPEVLQHKREVWLTPGSRLENIQHSGVEIKDYQKNLAKFYGATPNSSAAPSAPPSAGFVKSQAKFYGATPPVSASKQNQEFNKNVGLFYGVTPPQTGALGKNPQQGPGVSNNSSRPISQNTEFQVNKQKFYLSTPAEELLYRKNAKAFYENSGKNRSTLASAGRNVIQ